MAIAQIVNKELKLNNDKITLGSVLPDLTIKKKSWIITLSIYR